jgi:hypothetical protein
VRLQVACRLDRTPRRRSVVDSKVVRVLPSCSTIPGSIHRSHHWLSSDGVVRVIIANRHTSIHSHTLLSIWFTDETVIRPMIDLAWWSAQDRKTHVLLAAFKTVQTRNGAR